MSNTYTQIHIQAVFAVQRRIALIEPTWQEELNRYITAIIQNKGHKVLAINGMPDHLHIFFGFRPTQSLSDLMRDVKSDSSTWINKKRLSKGWFSWQEGYGGFSYCKSEVPKLIDYVRRQQEHHSKISFLEEYVNLLMEFEIDYDPAYIFKSPA